MIKTLLMAMTCLTTAVVCAQNDDSFGFGKGDVTLSGNVILNSSVSEDTFVDDTFNQSGKTKQLGFVFEPSVGYFLSNHVAVGARLSVSRSKGEREGRFKNTSEGLTYGVFGRYYFTPQNRFSFFTGIEASLLERKGTGESINEGIENMRSSTKTNGFSIDVVAGINYFVSPHFALSARLGLLSYDTFTTKIDGDTFKDHNFLLNTQLQNIAFGFLYRI